MSELDPHRARLPAVFVGEFPGREAVARDAAARWSADADSLAHVSDGASFTYRFTTASAGRYLRLVPPGWQGRPELEAELAFIDHLGANGIPAAAAVPAASGARIETMPSAIGELLAVVFDEVPGIATDDIEWMPEQANEVGRLMARMHIAAQGFRMPAGAERDFWRDELVQVRGELDAGETRLLRIVAEAEALFERLPQTPDVYGVVHFDLSGDNIIWRGLDATAIDFDDCMHNWFIADIARTVATFRTNDNGLEAAIEGAFIDGYQAVRQLDDRSAALLPAFIRFMNVCELAWMLYASRTAPDRITFDSAAEARLRNLIG